MLRERRGIQYAAAPRLKHFSSGMLGRPVKPDDDIEYSVRKHPALSDMRLLTNIVDPDYFRYAAQALREKPS